MGELCDRYAGFLEANPQTDLDDFCFTIGAGRRHYEQRIAVPFRSRAELVEKLSVGSIAFRRNSNSERQGASRRFTHDSPTVADNAAIKNNPTVGQEPTTGG